jgi:hypothetical protein
MAAQATWMPSTEYGKVHNRAELPESVFAFPRQRKEPLTDASHVKNALARFDQVEGVSDQIRNGNLNDLVRNAQSFARLQPTAFLGLAVLAGFGAVRFLKSSSEADSTVGGDKIAGRSSAIDNREYRNDFEN